MERTVLVVDDDPAIRSMLRDFLESRGCRVVEAQNGAEGFLSAQKERPSLIIMDLNMPLVEGESAVHVLREFLETAAIPILIFSGEDSVRVDRFMGFGHKLDYLPKGTPLPALWERAQALLGSGKA